MESKVVQSFPHPGRNKYFPELEAGSMQWGPPLAVGAGVTHGVLAVVSGSQAFEGLGCIRFIPDDSQHKPLEMFLLFPTHHPQRFLFHCLQFCIFNRQVWGVFGSPLRRGGEGVWVFSVGFFFFPPSSGPCCMLPVC